MVTLLAVVSGSMGCAFYLGFLSGRSIGFGQALAASSSEVPRIPIDVNAAAQEDAAVESSDIYAKLNGREQPAKVAEEAPPIVQTGNDSPILDLTSPEAVEGEGTVNAAQENRDAAVRAGLVDAPPADGVRVLGSSPHDTAAQPIVAGDEQDVKTLGELLASQEAQRRPQQADNQEDLPAVRANPDQLAKEQTAKEQSAKEQSAVESDTRTKPAAPEAASKKVEKRSETLAKKASEPAVTESSAESAAPAALSSSARQVLPKGWFAQVAAPKKSKDAETLVDRLKGSGYPVVVERAQVRGEEYFRVLVGPQSSREKVEALIKRLKRERYVQGDPFARAVK